MPSSAPPSATTCAADVVPGMGLIFGLRASVKSRRSNNPLRYTPVAPCSTNAMEFAASSVALKLSTELISGFGAPFRTATPVPERARFGARRELVLLQQSIDDIVVQHC